MNYNDFFNFISSRRSVRNFNDKPVNYDDLLKIINAGIQAPSGSNLQGWKIKIVQNSDDIARMTEIIKQKVNKVATSWEDDLLKDELSRYSANFYFFKNAPVVLLIYAKNPAKSTKYYFGDSKLNTIKGAGSEMSTGMMMQNMMLAANTLDLHTCVLTGPMMASEELEKEFGCPRRYSISALMLMGHADKLPKSPGRNELENFILD